MSEEANKLLMMFIVDGYKSMTGNISKKTAIAMMKYVATDNDLQRLVNNSDYRAVLSHNEEAFTATQAAKVLADHFDIPLMGDMDGI